MIDNDKNTPSYGNVPAYDNAHPYGTQIAITNRDPREGGTNTTIATAHEGDMKEWYARMRASFAAGMNGIYERNGMLDPVPPYTGSEPIAAIAEPKRPKRIDEMDLDDYRRGIANL